ncbi:hypothetical protein [Streptomyces sp. NPDC056479]|uniref:hypothetical protein n=1 Tax=unclassified Streptomyces TaxID=2593676 RepID=UPI00367EE0AE
MSIAYGALGGLVVEIMVLYGRIAAWQEARHRALSRSRRRDRLPRLAKYVDPPSDALAALTRVSLGAGAGWIFSPQLTGGLAAVAVGATAPALLGQLGNLRPLQAAIAGGRAEPTGQGPTDVPGGAEVLES